MKPLVASLAIFLCGVCKAASFSSATASEDGTSVEMHTATGIEHAPRTQPDQEGFGSVQISADHEVIGWTVLITNCCTSYPLPRALVLYRRGRPPQVLTPTFSIWQWHFLSDGKSVAYMESLPHGLVPTFYERVRLSDGKQIAHFECWPGGMEGGPAEPTHKPKGDIPAWVKAFRPDDCRLARHDG